jgi:putative ABC transport system permease protein
MQAMKDGVPPRLAEWLLQRLVRGTLGGNGIVGDLAEEHHAVARSQGRLGAALWYWRHASGVAARVVAARTRGRLVRRRPAPSPFPMPGDSFMSELWRDIRMAARLLVHQRGFAFVVVLTLAVGLASNATVLALIDGLVLRPFPIRDIGRLVQVFSVNPSGGQLSERSEVSPADFVDWQRDVRTVDALVALEWWDATVAGRTEPERVQGFHVSPAFFQALGVGLGAGRGFVADEGQPGRNRVAVISHGLWERRFGSDPNVLGRTVALDGEPHVVVGVAPAGFDYPYGCDVWAPIAFSPDALAHRDRRYLTVVGRLREGARPADLQAELAAAAGRLARQFPAEDRGWTVNVLSLSESVVDLGARAFLVVQQVATLLILLLACVNVANLLVVRAADRHKELALRVALGASRWRVVRLLAIESLTLALLGAAAAVPLAWGALLACKAAMPANIARFIRGWDEVDVDLRVVGALAALAVASTVIFGLLPALRASRVNLSDALKTGGRSAAGGRHRLRNGMVVAEVALALTLLVAAGLSVRGSLNVLWRNDGYDPDRVMTLRVSLLGGRYETDEKQRQFFEQLVTDVRGLAGVEAAAVVNVVPASTRNGTSNIEIDGHPVLDAAQQRSADYRVATPGYFETLRIRLRSGRTLVAADTPASLRVAVVSQIMAERFWPGENPIGRRFHAGPAGGPWLTVVGVADDVRHNWFLNQLAPTFYVPFAQAPASDMVLVIRAAGDPAPMARLGRDAVLALDAGQPVYEVRSLRTVRSESAVGLSFAAVFMAGFGLIGLLLAAVGIYAIMAYAVRQRTHEIGVRVALGASRRAVLATTLGRGLRLTGIGLVIGLTGAYLLGALMERTLFGSVRLDALTFVVFTTVLAAAALAAAVIPARRALRVDPMIALRNQ